MFGKIKALLFIFISGIIIINCVGEEVSPKTKPNTNGYDQYMYGVELGMNVLSNAAIMGAEHIPEGFTVTVDKLAGKCQIKGTFSSVDIGSETVSNVSVDLIYQYLLWDETNEAFAFMLTNIENIEDNTSPAEVMRFTKADATSGDTVYRTIGLNLRGSVSFEHLNPYTGEQYPYTFYAGMSDEISLNFYVLNLQYKNGSFDGDNVYRNGELVSHNDNTYKLDGWLEGESVVSLGDKIWFKIDQTQVSVNYENGVLTSVVPSTSWKLTPLLMRILYPGEIETEFLQLFISSNGEGTLTAETIEYPNITEQEELGEDYKYESFTVEIK